MPPTTTQDVFDYQHNTVTAAALNAALELGLFWKFAGGTRTDAEIAAELNIPPRRCRAWLDVLASLGLLDAGGSAEARTYAVSNTAQSAILDGYPEIVWSFRAQRYRERYRLADDLAHTITYPGSTWEAQGLTPPRDYDLLRADPAWARRFTHYLYHLKLAWAPQWVEGFDLAAARRMLDLGGGSGVLSMELLRRFPDLTSVVFDLENVVAAARALAAAEAPDLAERLTFQAGDLLSDDLPAGFDFVLLADVGLHTVEVFRQAHAALNPGGRLAVIAPFANASEELPPGLASSAFQSTLDDPAAVPETIPDVQATLEEAGLSPLPPRASAQGFTVLEAVKLPAAD